MTRGNYRAMQGAAVRRMERRKGEMSHGNKPYYKVRFERLRALGNTKPDEARKELRDSGIWLFYKAIEADDLTTAHQLLVSSHVPIVNLWYSHGFGRRDSR